MHVVRCSWKLQPDHIIPITFDQVCLGMPKGLWYNNHQYLEKGLSLCCCFLHVVRHSWKLQFDHVIFLGFSQACSKCSEITNAIYLERVSYCINFLHAVRHSYETWLPACQPACETACLWKFWLSSCQQKCSRPVTLQDFFNINIPKII